MIDTRHHEWCFERSSCVSSPTKGYLGIILWETLKYDHFSWKKPPKKAYAAMDIMSMHGHEKADIAVRYVSIYIVNSRDKGGWKMNSCPIIYRSCSCIQMSIFFLLYCLVLHELIKLLDRKSQSPINFYSYLIREPASLC